MKLYMFRTVRLSIIRSSFTVHSAMVYVIQVCRQLSSGTRMVLLEPDNFTEDAVHLEGMKQEQSKHIAPYSRY